MVGPRQRRRRDQHLHGRGCKGDSRPGSPEAGNPPDGARAGHRDSCGRGARNRLERPQYPQRRILHPSGEDRDHRRGERGPVRPSGNRRPARDLRLPGLRGRFVFPGIPGRRRVSEHGVREALFHGPVFQRPGPGAAFPWEPLSERPGPGVSRKIGERRLRAAELHGSFFRGPAGIQGRAGAGLHRYPPAFSEDGRGDGALLLHHRAADV